MKKKVVYLSLSVILIVFGYVFTQNFLFYRSSLNTYLNNGFFNISASSDYIAHTIKIENKTISRSELSEVLVTLGGIQREYELLIAIGHKRGYTGLSYKRVSDLVVKVNMILNEYEPDPIITLGTWDIEVLTDVYYYCKETNETINRFNNESMNLISKNRWIELIEETIQ